MTVLTLTAAQVSTSCHVGKELCARAAGPQEQARLGRRDTFLTNHSFAQRLNCFSTAPFLRFCIASGFSNHNSTFENIVILHLDVSVEGYISIFLKPGFSEGYIHHIHFGSR